MARTTDIALVTGERLRVNGDPKDVERAILDAARGSLMEFAWVVDSETGDPVGVNPEAVATLRAAGDAPSESS